MTDTHPAWRTTLIFQSQEMTPLQFLRMTTRPQKDHRQIVDTIPGIERALPVQVSKKTVWQGSRRVEGTL